VPITALNDNLLTTSTGSKKQNLGKTVDE